MSSANRFEFSTFIHAPVEVVYGLMIDDDGYREWTGAFVEGSYFDGSWDEGARIRFLAPIGQGAVAEIAEHRPLERIAMRYLGIIVDGVDDLESEAAQAIQGALETYEFEILPEGTRVVIEQDIQPEYEAFMCEAWPRALARLKALCEDDS